MRSFDKRVLLSTAAVMVALSPLAAQKLQAAQVDVNVQAIIKQAISLTVAASMDFGILTETSGGAATLSFDNSITGSGLNPAGGSPSAGHVTIKSQAGSTILISSTAASFPIKNGGGGTNKSMTVSDISFKLGAATGPSLNVSPASPVNTLDIGAKLTGNGSQESGTYTGALKTNVVYP